MRRDIASVIEVEVQAGKVRKIKEWSGECVGMDRDGDVFMNYRE